jgi:hypothetical protein
MSGISCRRGLQVMQAPRSGKSERSAMPAVRIFPIRSGLQ